MLGRRRLRSWWKGSGNDLCQRGSEMVQMRLIGWAVETRSRPSADVVRERAPLGPQERERRREQEVRDLARVDVGVALDLAGEEALVVAGAHERSPRGIAQLARGARERRDLVVERVQRRAALGEARLGVSGVRLRGRRSVFPPTSLLRQAQRTNLALHGFLLVHQRAELLLRRLERNEIAHLALHLAE